jgi:hypothetical protein
MQVKPPAFATPGLLQQLDVGTCDECATGCGDQDGSHRRIFCKLLKSAEQSFVNVLTNGVHRWVVDHDHRDIRVTL